MIKEGSVVLSAKYLSEITKKLPKGFHLTVTKENGVTLKSENILTHLNGFNIHDYPDIPKSNQFNDRIQMKSEDLNEL
ncbi:hypothetical protein PB01_17100 [Psychrobacillus glaciei]|uniref:DNA polymerase III beta sliding clamp N-terminal domain-containing protein n=1 Tax=Psychrobacillus glaciei TaxID=2283160 RepID=A0A5J6SQZ2_9BACI|nr:hypothetical protein PB01_17100 [Psychrobacillus glaciei]